MPGLALQFCRPFPCMDVRMRNLLPIIIAVMLLGACDRQEPTRRGSSAPAADAQPSDSPTADAAKRTEAYWVLQPGAEASVLVLQAQTGSPILSLTCPSGGNRLQVIVPGFTPIGSEERLSFGSGGEVEALVADFRGDRRLGGVSAAGAVPANLAALMGGPVSASYGSQTSGPHPSDGDCRVVRRRLSQPGIRRDAARGIARPSGQPLLRSGRPRTFGPAPARNRNRTVLGRADRRALRHLFPPGGPERHTRLDPVHAHNGGRRVDRRA